MASSLSFFSITQTMFSRVKNLMALILRARSDQLVLSISSRRRPGSSADH